MSIWKRVRSAITGRFVKQAEAEKNPNTTIAETVKKDEKPKQ